MLSLDSEKYDKIAAVKKKTSRFLKQFLQDQTKTSQPNTII